MQNHPGACSPEMLHSRQRIFDAIWIELESKHSRHTFPWDAQSARFQIAHYLLDYLNDVPLDPRRIKQDVLQRLEEGR
jgi:hypothetical protein